jgi:hypothetical protein
MAGVQDDGGTDGIVDTTVDAADAPSDVAAEEAAVDPCAVATAEGNVIGCDYIAISPSRMGVFPYACLAAIVANTSNSAVSVQVTLQSAPQALAFHANLIVGQGQSASYSAWPTSNEVPPHGTAVISLAQGGLDQDDTACPSPPIVADVNEGTVTAAPNGTAHAFRIQTSAPTVVYEVWPFTQNDIDISNVVALRAAPSWQSSYVDVGTYLPGCDAGGAELATGNTWTAVLASTDGTVVTLPSAQAGAVGATLGATELLNVARCDEFIGQSIAAPHPIAVWTGTAGVQVPWYSDEPTSNAPFLQIPPVSEWGYTYPFAAPNSRIVNVAERTFFRIITTADGTTLTYSPAAPTGAPTSLDHGQMGTFYSYGPFVVSSQDGAHPIFVMAHMVDPRDFDPDGGAEEGSNAMHSVLPTERWGLRYDLFLPFNYPASELVVVRPLGAADVTSDCAGAVTGWTAIDGTYEYARLAISTDANGVFNPQAYDAGVCDNGVRSLSSVAPFGVTSYGWISMPFATYGSLPPPHIDVGSSYAYTPLTSHATLSSDGGTN